MENRKIRDRNNLIASDQWEIDGHSSASIYYDAKGFRIDEGRKALAAIQEVLESSPQISNSGAVAVRFGLLILKDIKEQIRLLNMNQDECKWGEKSLRRKILANYRTTDHKYDNHIDEKTNLLNALMGFEKLLENHIRQIANEFSIEIPLKKQSELFGDFLK